MAVRLKESSSVSLLSSLLSKVQVMPILRLSPPEIEVRRRPLAGQMVPAIGERDTTDYETAARGQVSDMSLLFSRLCC